MSSPDQDNSLLPPNVTELEYHLEQVVKKATDLPVPIAQLWDPHTCPLSLLPWLAWAFSVDEWDDRWPEHIKRQVVQNSFDIHRYKGTPYAVQEALDSLNIKTHLREWWASNGSQEPGTMTVVALINENLTDNDEGVITREMLEQVTRVIKSARRGVIHFDVELGLALEESFAFSAAVGPSIGVMADNLESEPVVPDAISAGLGYSGVIHRLDFNDQQVEFSPLVPGLVFASPQLTGVSHQMCLSDINLEGILY
ncbi:phage tail protein I [Thalassomonas actiniarum]|uniref:Phage tail protein I n=1 Tax=Thalassomonas actiniarum TaxID=485447 RepID=A0AAF0C0G5_9GAMM|nr:phage tail protein I [Thalassomonas actiniarum]WDD98376.1 phage tail protein I [Thalassomonas actiniarum]